MKTNLAAIDHDRRSGLTIHEKKLVCGAFCVFFVPNGAHCSCQAFTMFALDVPVAFGLFFTLFWAATRVQSYYFWTLEESVADFKRIVLPSDIDPSVVSTFVDTAVSSFFGAGERRSAILLHVALGALLTALFTFQLLPITRTRFYRAHRFIGYYLIGPLSAVFIVHISYVLFVKGMVNMGPVVFWQDVIALFGVLIGVALGVAGIRGNDVALHRAGMILMAASFNLNACQRFFWSIFAKLNLFGGPYKTFEAFVQGPTSMSAYVSIVVNYGLAALLIWAGPGLRDTVQISARRKRLADLSKSKTQ